MITRISQTEGKTMDYKPKQFPDQELRKVMIELTAKRERIKFLKEKSEGQSKIIMQLQESLDSTKQQLEISHQQYNILTEFSKKLDGCDEANTMIRDKVVLEAKIIEAQTLRQQNLQIQMENLNLNHQLEEVRNDYKNLVQQDSGRKTKQEEISKVVEIIQKQMVKLSQEHNHMLKTSNSFKDEGKAMKILVDYHQRQSMDFMNENEKLQEEIKYLSNELEELKKTLKYGSESQTEQNLQLQHWQNSVKSKDEMLNNEKRNNLKLQTALAVALENSKKLYLQKQELEEQLQKFKRNSDPTFPEKLAEDEKKNEISVPDPLENSNSSMK